MSENVFVVTPHDHALRGLSAAELVELWQSARVRTLLAEHELDGEPDPTDWWTELVVGARLAHEVTAGRWCVVARLLRRGVVTSWAQLADAMAMTETQARDGFAGWIAGQVALGRHHGTIGMTDTDADELRRLVELVPMVTRAG